MQNRSQGIPAHPLKSCIVDDEYGIYRQEFFEEAVLRERKRSERSGNTFAVMLVEFPAPCSGATALGKTVARIVLQTVRETDLTGWCRYGAVVGILITDIDKESNHTALKTIEENLRKRLHNVDASLPSSPCAISFHVFPDSHRDLSPHDRFNQLFYPELRAEGSALNLSAGLKRGMDIVGSIAGLILFSPLFAAISVAVKLTSDGPVLFKQERYGRNGKRFMFLKFRSMYVNNDDGIHREYIKKLISDDGDSELGKEGIYKIKQDPRVTPVGGFLRKTSLDELPQFINVLRGEMSLVGPRPPIDYEVDTYEAWHRYRLLGAKPGITGLWQVRGRSRTKFDGMVRMDIDYIRKRSLWLDLKILWQTPVEVLKCRGAY